MNRDLERQFEQLREAVLNSPCISTLAGMEELVVSCGYEKFEIGYDTGLVCITISEETTTSKVDRLKELVAERLPVAIMVEIIVDSGFIIDETEVSKKRSFVDFLEIGG